MKKVFVFLAVVVASLSVVAAASATRVVRVHVDRGIAPSAGGAQIHCESTYGTGITYADGNGDGVCHFADYGGTIAIQAFYYQSCFTWWTQKAYGNPAPFSNTYVGLTLSYGGWC